MSQIHGEKPCIWLFFYIFFRRWQQDECKQNDSKIADGNIAAGFSCYRKPETIFFQQKLNIL